MDFLIVTMSFNRDLFYICKTLNSIYKQDTTGEIRIKINVIVNSMEDKKKIEEIKCSSTFINTKVMVLDDISRSKARNKGVVDEKYDYLIFIDGDVVLGENFFSNIVKASDDSDVIIPYLYGYNISADEQCGKLLLNSKNISKTELDKNEEYWDVREYSYCLCGDDLMELKVPWTNAWSTIIVLKQGWFEKVGGFDEKFVRWGSEDIDFSYRLFKEGARFSINREIYGIHTPHNMEGGSRIANGNRDILFSKHMDLNTEILTVCPGYKLEGILASIKNAAYSSSTLDVKTILDVNKTIKEKKSICLGFPRKNELMKLNFDYYYIPDNQYANFVKKWTQASVRSSVLVNTNFESQFIDIIYILGWINYITDDSLKKAIIAEAHRIAKRVIIVNE